jgi:hypothetical protein
MPEVIRMRRENGGMETGEDADSTGGKVYAKPFIVRKRIGATYYEVAAYFSRSGRESLDEKILRLVRSEALNGGADR